MKNIKINQLKSIHHWVRESSSTEICFVALLVFPLLISVYAGAISIAGLDEFKYWVYSVITVFYVLAILVMKIKQSNNEKLQMDLVLIKSHSKAFNLDYISFDKLKEKDSRFNKHYIYKLISAFPEELIIAKFDNNKKEGVKILK
jgi:hypothetical protein